jgi:hypothetical protein
VWGNEKEFVTNGIFNYAAGNASNRINLLLGLHGEAAFGYCDI